MAAPVTTSYGHIQDSAGPTTDPTTSSVLADTGALVSGMYQCLVFVGCSVAAKYSIQHRNAANTAAASDVIVVRAAAGQTSQFAFKLSVNKDERVRILPQANITGEGEATIQVFRIA